MTNARLVACPRCARHVRVSEENCPFCRSGLPDAFGAGPAPRKPSARLSRAALYALGATSLSVAAVTVGCGSSGGNASDGGGDQMVAADSPDELVAAYGCPADVCGHPVDAGGSDAGSDGGGGLDVTAAYGCPADVCGFADAGSDTGAEAAADSPAGFDVVAAYGCPADVCGPFEAGSSEAGISDGPGADGDGGIVAAYGGPPGDAFPVDVSPPPLDGGAGDGEAGVVAAYGLPPSD